MLVKLRPGRAGRGAVIPRGKRWEGADRGSTRAERERDLVGESAACHAVEIDLSISPGNGPVRWNGVGLPISKAIAPRFSGLARPLVGAIAAVICRHAGSVAHKHVRQLLLLTRNVCVGRLDQLAEVDLPRPPTLI